MSKTAKIICAVVGGIGVVAAGVVVASKIINSNKTKYISNDTLEDILPVAGKNDTASIIE